jgi:hypothetical protein
VGTRAAAHFPTPLFLPAAFVLRRALDSFAPTADPDHPGILIASPSESVIAFGGIPANQVEAISALVHVDALTGTLENAR